jgi:hypothetical protein
VPHSKFRQVPKTAQALWVGEGADNFHDSASLVAMGSASLVHVDDNHAATFSLPA